MPAVERRAGSRLKKNRMKFVPTRTTRIWLTSPSRAITPLPQQDHVHERDHACRARGSSPGPAIATRIDAVDICHLRLTRDGCHCTGLPQPKPPTPPVACSTPPISGSSSVPIGSACASGFSVTRPCRRGVSSPRQVRHDRVPELVQRDRDRPARTRWIEDTADLDRRRCCTRALRLWPRRARLQARRSLRDARRLDDLRHGAPARASTRRSTCTSIISRSSAACRAHTLDGYGRDLARFVALRSPSAAAPTSTTSRATDLTDHLIALAADQARARAAAPARWSRSAGCSATSSPSAGSTPIRPS